MDKFSSLLESSTYGKTMPKSLSVNNLRIGLPGISNHLLKLVAHLCTLDYQDSSIGSELHLYLFSQLQQTCAR